MMSNFDGRVIAIIVFLTFSIACKCKNFGYSRFSWKITRTKGLNKLSSTIDTKQTGNDINTQVNAVPSLKGVKTKIIQLISPSSIEAVQLRHIEVETHEMAAFCKSLLVNNSIPLSDVWSNSQSFRWDFASLAANISRCDRSKVVGGDLGWIFLDQTGKSNSDDLLASLAQEATVLQKGVCHHEICTGLYDVRLNCTL